MHFYYTLILLYVNIQLMSKCLLPDSQTKWVGAGRLATVFVFCSSVCMSVFPGDFYTVGQAQLQFTGMQQLQISYCSYKFHENTQGGRGGTRCLSPHRRWASGCMQLTQKDVAAVTTTAVGKLQSKPMSSTGSTAPAVGLIHGRLSWITFSAHATSLFVMQWCSPPFPFKMQPATSNWLLSLSSQSFSIPQQAPRAFLFLLFFNSGSKNPFFFYFF